MTRVLLLAALALACVASPASRRETPEEVVLVDRNPAVFTILLRDEGKTSRRIRANLALHPLHEERLIMIWVTDHRGYCTYLGQEWYDLTGQKPSDAIGTGWIEAVHPDDRAAIAEGFTEACRRQVEFMLRYRLRRANGTYVWVLDAASPSFTPLTHDFVGFLGLVSRYEDEAQGLTAKAEIGTFKPGLATGEFAPMSKIDIAADHLIAARALTVEYGGEVADAIDNALHALGQALKREQAGMGSPSNAH